MATVSTNTGRFVAFDIEGGRMIFDWAAGTGGGTDDYSVLGIIEGSLEIVRPDVERIADMDKGVFITTPRRGRATAGSIRARVKCTNDVSANSIIAHSADNDDSSGGIPTFELTIERPDYRGASTGLRRVYTHCYFSRPVGIKAGAQYDEGDIDIVCLGTETETDY